MASLRRSKRRASEEAFKSKASFQSSPASEQNLSASSTQVRAQPSTPQRANGGEDHAERPNSSRDGDYPSPATDSFADDVPSAPGEQQDQTSPKTQAAIYAASGGYNALKSFNGQVYSGMAIGGSHTWNYDPGIWKETKEEPDLWKIDFETTKRRAKNAPTGSGAPVGTEYHWLIVAHQYVIKVDANTYSTHLVGSKYKLAHKNASSNSWSVSTVKKQRDREIELLDDAKQRVHGLPPVLGNEKVKVEKHEKGQQKLDTLFSKTTPRKDGMNGNESKKRKREAEVD